MRVDKRRKWQRMGIVGILLVLAWACGYGSTGENDSDRLHALTPGKVSAAAVKDSPKPSSVRLGATHAGGLGLSTGAGAAGAVTGMGATQLLKAQNAAEKEAEAAKPASPVRPVSPTEPVKPVKTKPAPTKTVMLTFDDGPDGKYTPQILSILKKNDVKATFFVVGTQIKKYPKTLKQIVNEGHAIGNHTYHHADLSIEIKAGIIQEIESNNTIIKQAIGYTPSLFRAPYGALSPTLRSVLKDEHFKLVG